MPITFLKLFQRHIAARNVIIDPPILVLREQFSRFQRLYQDIVNANNFPKNYSKILQERNVAERNVDPPIRKVPQREHNSQDYGTLSRVAATRMIDAEKESVETR